MNDGLRSYPKYKDSGVPWLGRVPAHWEVTTLGRIANAFKTGPFGSILHASDYVSAGVPIINPVHMTEGRISPNKDQTVDQATLTRLNEYILKEGDLIFSRRGELGRCALVRKREADWLLGTGSMRVRLASHTLNREYVITSLQASWVGEFLSSLSLGATMESLNTPILKRLPILVPSLEEQAAIANYLDANAALVRKFIRNRRRLIEVLSEQKQAIINRAVTRGLDSNVKLKPSGVEWLGDVPEHWERRRLKFLVRNVNEQTASRLLEDIYVALEHVESWTGRITLSKEELTFDSQVKRFQPNDVLFGKLRPYLAKVTRPQVKGVCVGEFLVLRTFEPDILPEFLEQKLRSKQLITIINGSTFGAKMPRADWTFIGNLTITFPPTRDEQRDILVRTTEQTETLSCAIEQAQREIDLIREYRTRLIADVVTGKLDVRHLAPPSGSLEAEELAGIEADDSLDDESVEEDADLVEESSDADD